MNVHQFNRNLGLRIVASSVVIVVCFFVRTELPAQQFDLGLQGGQNRPSILYKQYMEQLDQIKTKAESRITSCLVDVDRACDLADAQRKKLEVAAKGAVNERLIEATKVIVDSAKQVGFDFEPGNPPKEEKKDENKNNLIGVRDFVFFRDVNTGNGSVVEQKKIWKNAVKNTLTEKQNEKLNAWIEQRRVFIRKAAVDNFIARVDVKLLLSPAQRNKIADWIDRNYGKQLAEQLVSSSLNQGQRIFSAPQIQVQDTEEKIQPAVAAILDESQWNQWKQSFQQELDGLSGLNGFAPPVINILPAPTDGRIQNPR